MRAPAVEVELSSGRTVPLESLYSERPLALVFLRHLGCVFCRRHVHQLKRYPDLNIAFVTMSPPEEANLFANKLGSPHPFICDTSKRLYDSFGLKRATTSQVIGPRVILRGFAALKHGMGRPPTDPLQLGGTFILNTSGEVTWSHRQSDISDNATPQQIQNALQEAAKERTPSP